MAFGVARAAAVVVRFMAFAASTVVVWPMSRFENLSTSLSNLSLISLTVDFRWGMVVLCLGLIKIDRYCPGFASCFLRY